jgi:hypothetical protein
MCQVGKISLSKSFRDLAEIIQAVEVAEDEGGEEAVLAELKAEFGIASAQVAAAADFRADRLEALRYALLRINGNVADLMGLKKRIQRIRDSLLDHTMAVLAGAGLDGVRGEESELRIVKNGGVQPLSWRVRGRPLDVLEPDEAAGIDPRFLEQRTVYVIDRRAVEEALDAGDEEVEKLVSRQPRGTRLWIRKR